MVLFLGFLFMVFMFAIVFIFTQFFSVFVNFPSLVLILVPLLFFLLVTKSGKVIGKYIKTSFQKNYAYTIIELKELSAAIKHTVKFILAAGGFGFITFVIVCLGYIGSNEKFGPNLAICFITLTYSIAIAFFVFFPVQAWAENKINSLKNND